MWYFGLPDFVFSGFGAKGVRRGLGRSFQGFRVWLGSNVLHRRGPATVWGAVQQTDIL